MRVVDLVPPRFHSLTTEFAKFGTIGVINIGVNMAVYNILLATIFHSGEAKAKAVAAVVATTSAYFMNRHWTYRDRAKSALHREYVLFFLTNAVGLVIETGTVYITKYWLHQTHAVALNTAALMGIGLGTIFRFWAYRTHVFKLSPAETLDELSMPDFDGSDLDVSELAELADPAPVSPMPVPRVVVTTGADGMTVLRIHEPG